MRGQAALQEFYEHIKAGLGKPDGGHIGCGDVWDPEDGWRVYVNVDEKALALSPAQARRFAELFLRKLRKPRMAAEYAGLKSVFEEMLKASIEAKEKNRKGVVPDQVLAAVPPAGGA